MKLPEKTAEFGLLIVFLLVFVSFCYWRFCRLEERIIFDWDQERDAYVIRQILTEGKLTLVGPRVLGPEGFFLGPYFSYLLLPFYSLAQLDPLALVDFVAVYNLIFFFGGFLVLRKIFSPIVALLFLAIWANNPVLIKNDILPWNPLLLPLFILFLWLAVKEKRWFLAGLITGLGINFHLQMIFLLPFSLIFLIGTPYVIRGFLKFFSGFALTFLPLLFFDLRHGFLNIKLLGKLLSRQNIPTSFWSWLQVWENFLKELIGVAVSGPAVYLVVLAVLFFLALRLSGFFKKFYFATATLWLFFPLGFMIWGQRPSEYYFNFLCPYIILLISHFLSFLSKKAVYPLLILMIFSSFGAKENQVLLAANPLGMHYKSLAVKEIWRVSRGKNFNISYSVPSGYDSGYRYLLDFYNIKQSGNNKDALVKIVIPPDREPVAKVFGGIGVFIPESF